MGHRIVKIIWFVLICANSVEIKSMFAQIPKDVGIPIFRLATNGQNSFEQLQKLLNLRCVNKHWHTLAHTFFTTELEALKKLIPVDPTENILFATAIQRDLVFCLFHFLKDAQVREAKKDRLVYDNLYPLHIAAKFNAENVTKLLLSAEADINQKDTAQNYAPVEMAIIYKSNVVSKLLIDAEFYAQCKTSFNKQKWHALQTCAAHASNGDIVNYVHDSWVKSSSWL